ncbi:MAG: AraC family transcriptional regulator [Paenibacillaceae bacterium]|nr:AraC family transcriptional regulator [Paenibacillaceae bacterium]
MVDESWWGIVPELVLHNYWHEKEQFELESDYYANWTIFAVVEGKFQYEINGQRGTAIFPELIICPPETEFRRQVLEPLSFHFLSFRLMSADKPLLVLPGGNPGRLVLADTHRLTATYSQLRNAAGLTGRSGMLWRDHLLKDIWRQHIFEQLFPDQSDPMPKPLSSHIDPAAEAAARLIEEHAFSSLSLSSVAEGLGITPVQLTRKYKAAYGITPSEHVTALRIRKACSLLSGTTHSLEWIAEACGYENAFYFSRIFAKRMKLSPSSYRKAYRI